MSPGKWLRGLKMFILVEELGEFKRILNTFGVYVNVSECVCMCVCMYYKKYNLLYQVSEVMAWGLAWNLHGGEVGSTKWSAFWGLWLPCMARDTLCVGALLVTGWPRWLDKALRTVPMMQRDMKQHLNTNEGGNQNKAAALPHQWLSVRVQYNFFFFLQVARGMPATGMKKILNHIICCDNTILGWGGKSLLYTYCFCTDMFYNRCDQAWNHKRSPSPPGCSSTTRHMQGDQWWCRLVLIIIREKKNQWNIWLSLMLFNLWNPTLQ